MRTLFVTAGPPLPADRGARVRDLALIRRVAAERSTSLLALVGSAGERSGLEPLRESLESLEAAVVRERPRVPVRLRPGGPRSPLACAPFLDAGAVAAFAAAVERERPDLVQLEHWFLAPLLEALPPARRPAMVSSLHNVASAQYRAMAGDSAPASAMGYRLKSRLALGVERRLLERFDAVVCVSRRDRELAAAVAPRSQIEVVPNGVDCDVLRPLPDDGEAGTVLFVANLEYRPNLQAATWLCRRVLPALARTHRGARVRLVGPGGGRRAASLGRLPRVDLVGPVDDLLPHYRAARVAVAPLHAGGGTRLKVLEAMALGRPVVATSIGCEGLGLIAGEQALIADDPAGFAAAIARLLDSADDRRALAAAGRALVERDHDWAGSAATLMAAHDRAVSRRGDQGRKRRAATA